MQPPWQPRPGDVVVRRPRQSEIGPVRIHVERRSVPVRGPASPMLLVYGFLGLAAIGTGLLLLPVSRNEDGFTPFLTAMFTAVSAVTVTGLVVENTGGYWTDFGHVVLFVLAFIGGLGFMTSAAFLLIIVGQRIGMQSRLAIREGLGVQQLGGLPQLIKRIVLLSVIVQLTGIALLFLRFYVFDDIWDGVSLGRALWQSAFLAVSAFNNAGLDILPPDRVPGGSLVAFRSDLWVMGIVGSLVVIGGLGYLAIFDIFTLRFSVPRFWRRGGRRGRRSRRGFSFETKIVLTGTAILLVLGAVLLFALERDNDGTLGSLSTGDKVANAVFGSVTARTAGFAAMDYGSERGSTNVVTEGLMFIGAASASTAGGIKLNTFAIIVITVVATVRGRRNISAFNREIPDQLARRSLVIGALATATLGILLITLAAVEDMPLGALLFETVSALGTVGLSTGITPSLGDGGRIIIATAMFVGRFGPLTLALLMAGREGHRDYRYVVERVRIG